jgi:hypothetical protein
LHEEAATLLAFSGSKANLFQGRHIGRRRALLRMRAAVALRQSPD